MESVLFVESVLNLMKWRVTILFLGVRVGKQRLTIVRCSVSLAMRKKQININVSYMPTSNLAKKLLEVLRPHLGTLF